MFEAFALENGFAAKYGVLEGLRYVCARVRARVHQVQCQLLLRTCTVNVHHLFDPPHMLHDAGCTLVFVRIC
jgi:hypothetical protein